MNKFAPKSAQREAFAEGAAEVREKLKSDFSRWSRVRRFATLQPTMGCRDCDATGKILCATCEGTGRARYSFGEEAEACATCDGTGHVTCVDCAGSGTVPNTHRKKILALLVIGGIAWGYIFFRLWNRDILPGVLAEGGGRKIVRPGNAPPPVSGAMTAPPGAPGGGQQ